MRIRSIKPEFWQDERMAACSRDSRLLFIGLWNLADDFGVLRGNPRLIKGQVFPFDDVDVGPLLAELEDARRIVRYRPDGEDLVLIRNFTRHQKLDRRVKNRPVLPPGFHVLEVSAEDADGKMGISLRVAEIGPPQTSPHNQAPPFPADKPAGPADSRRSPPFPSVGRDGTGRDGTVVGPQADGDPTTSPPTPEIAFFTWADEQRRLKYPNALPDPTPVGFVGWYRGALRAAGGDPPLRAAWLHWLEDTWAQSRKTPCPMAAFIGDRVWFQHVPGQSEGKRASADKARVA